MLYLSLVIGIVLIVIGTKLTETFGLSFVWTLLFQACVSLLIIIVGKLDLSQINFNSGNYIELGYLTIPFTLFFLLGFTNAMNMNKVQSSSILLLPFVSIIFLSVVAFIIGHSFVFLTGICSSLMILLIILYSYFTGKIVGGRTLNTSISFIIAVLSIQLLELSIVTIYIPIFTFALPITFYSLIQYKATDVQNITVSLLVAIFFGVLMFILPLNLLWYLVIGLMIILVLMQFSPKYRFI